MTYKVLYLCHNAEIFVYRTYSTDQYDCKDAARETIACSNCLYVGDRVWDIEAASLSYIGEAQKTGKPLPIPEPKIVFTVKLPVKLVDQIRMFSRRTGQSLSELVTEALVTFLK